MSDKTPSTQSSFGNSPAGYAGALAAISTALIRMFVPAEYVENSLTIVAALSPIVGVWLFSYLLEKKRSDAQLTMEAHITKRLAFLDQQLANEHFSTEQKETFLKEKERLILEYTQLNRSV